MQLLRHGPRTEHEARTRLTASGFGPTDVDDAVRRAIDARLLDDRLYAKLWVEDRVQRRPLSRRAVEYELADRGVARAVIAEALDVGYPPELETQVAERVASQRYARDRSPDPERRRRRIVDYLIRRGFSTSVAFAAIRKAEGEAMSDD
jgi:regulatory protein